MIENQPGDSYPAARAGGPPAGAAGRSADETIAYGRGSQRADRAAGYGGGRHADETAAYGRGGPPAADETVILPALNDQTVQFSALTGDTVRLAALTGSLAPVGARNIVGPAETVGAAGSPEAAQAEAKVEGKSVARQSAGMAIGSMIGRVTGLIRTIALGAAIGAGVFSNQYTLANNLPNMVYELLMGGVLAATVVPTLVRARMDSSDGGVTYAQRLLSAATIFLTCATAVAVLCAPLLRHVIAAGGNAADHRVVTILSYLLLPEILFYGVAALLGAVLNSRGQFAAPMWAPILNNIVVIGTCGVFVLLPTVTDPPTSENASMAQLLVLGIGSTLGIVAQAAGLFPALRRGGFRWKWRFDWRLLNVGELARLATWTLVYVVVNQVAVIAVFNIANLAGDPGPTIYNNAFLMIYMVYGIVAVSITTALMPRMAAAAHAKRLDQVNDLIVYGMRLSLVILIPATVAFLVLGRQIAVTLFQIGAYSHDDAIQTGWVIAIAGLSLIPFSLNQLQIFAFYAQSNTKTPALANIPVAAVRIGIDVLALALLPHTWVAAALMVGNAASYMVGMVIEGRLLRKRLGALPIGQVMSTVWRLAVSGLVAAAATLAVVAVLEHEIGLGKVGSLVGAVTGGVVLVGVYVAVGLMLKTPEMRQLGNMVMNKVRPARAAA